MDNENTQLINDSQKNGNVNRKEEKKGMSKGVTAAAAGAGGFVVGAAAGAAVSAAASNRHEEPVKEDEIKEDAIKDEAKAEEEHQIPKPEDVLLANDEGIRVAHVDADNFETAFAQAREQVGPGGVFEYEGKLYGTYYADEWNSMSREEKSEFQAKVTDTITPESDGSRSDTPHITNNYTHVEVHHHPENTPGAHTAANHEATPVNHNQHITAEPVNDEIKVLGVETVDTGDGNYMDIYGVAVGDDQALLIDIEGDGKLDVLVHDDNNDNMIQENEYHDIRDLNLTVEDLGIESPHDDYYTASDDTFNDTFDDPNIMPV